MNGFSYNINKHGSHYLVRLREKIYILEINRCPFSMEIFHPITLKAKIFVRILKLLKYLKLAHLLSNIQRVDLVTSESIKNIIDESIEVSKYSYSLFLGTHSQDRKIVIMFYNKIGVYGYGKLSISKNSVKLIHNEHNILRKLNYLEFKNIPAVLNFISNDNYSFLIQSNIKKHRSRMSNKFNQNHIFFLNKMFNTTKKNIVFEKTDYFLMLSELLQLTSNIVVAESVMEIIEDNRGKIVEYALCHRDFAPWNIHVNKDYISVYDFEYARMTYPKYIDYFHFFTQFHLLIKGLTSAEIYQEFIYRKKELSFILNTENVFMMYLLDMIFLYLNRGDSDESSHITKWIELLSIIKADIGGKINEDFDAD